MATQHINASTFTTATPILTVSSNARPLTPVNIHNGHSAAIFIGDASITTSGATIGRTIPANGNQILYVHANDVVYGISAAASATGAIVITYSA
jgi:hypothetical protein